MCSQNVSSVSVCEGDNIETGSKVDEKGEIINNETVDILIVITGDCKNLIGEKVRICSQCKKIMTDGYCIEGGIEYYCSDECLYKNITKEEYLELFDNGEGDTYWTIWE